LSWAVESVASRSVLGSKGRTLGAPVGGEPPSAAAVERKSPTLNKPAARARDIGDRQFNRLSLPRIGSSHKNATTGVMFPRPRGCASRLYSLAMGGQPESPRIAALRRDLEAGDTAALETFWREVKERGTPLIEPVPDDPMHYRVTFVWKGNEDTENVVVLSRFPSGQKTNRQMQRLPETDLWYSPTYLARSDERTMYTLSPNHPELLGVTPENWREMSQRQADPLNRFPLIVPRDDDHLDYEPVFGPQWTLSQVILPGALRHDYLEPRPGVPTGKLEPHRVQSVVLGNERRVWVYAPPGYLRGGGPYGLLLIFDGWSSISINRTPTVLDNLIGEGAIPPVVAVFVDHPDLASRMKELPCNPRFDEFLINELLPWAHMRYDVTTDATRRAVAGLSYGGLAAGFVALRHPDLFGNVLSQSGSFYWRPDAETEHEWLAGQLATSPALPIRWYLEVGRYEGLLEDEPFEENWGPGILVANRHLRTVLQIKGYQVHYSEFSGAHDFGYWRWTFPLALKTLLGTRKVESADELRGQR
jgi:enterochelin esterase-like enzyme